MSDINIVYPWERNQKWQQPPEMKKHILYQLANQKFDVDKYTLKDVPKKWMKKADVVIKLLCQKPEYKDNWFYVGSNSFAFVEFMGWIIPLTICFTNSYTLCQTDPQELIKLFLARKPQHVMEEDLAGRRLSVIKSCHLLTFKRFLVPNPALPKLVGSFGDLLGVRNDLRRPGLFLDVRDEFPTTDKLFEIINDSYGRVVKHMFKQFGHLKYYKLDDCSKDLAMENL